MKKNGYIKWNQGLEDWLEEDVEEHDVHSVAIKDELGNVVAIMKKEVFAGIMLKGQPLAIRPRL